MQVKKIKRILAIDPSSTCTGWAVFDGDQLYRYGNIKKAPLMPTLIGLLLKYEPDKVIYECAAKVPYARSRKNLHVYIEVVKRVTVLLVERFGSGNVYEVDAPTWKQSLNKKGTIDNMNLLYGLTLENKDNDTADAIGLGTWFIERQKFNPILSLGDKAK